MWFGGLTFPVKADHDCSVLEEICAPGNLHSVLFSLQFSVINIIDMNRRVFCDSDVNTVTSDDDM
jgi:hypothetical protein